MNNHHLKVGNAEKVEEKKVLSKIKTVHVDVLVEKVKLAKIDYKCNV